MKKSLLRAWSLLFAFVPLFVLAQTRQISGTVTDDKGNPLAAVSVVQKGTNVGTTTNNNGSFSLAVTGASPVLVFSYTGMQSKELAVGTGNTYNIALTASGNLSEVVVTALGIRREKRSLGYTVQTVNSEDLNMNRQSNLVNAMQGKVAGVTISSTGGAPGQGARILIRGINSLNAGSNNQPLFIVDGVEVDNSTFVTGGGDTRGMSNRASDINPDDVESISILRGGAATALYGIRAANGAVLITTKSARAGKMQVTYTGSYGVDEVNKTPDVQTKFTQGYVNSAGVPAYDPTSFWPSWGPTVEEAKAIDPTHPDQIFNNFERAYKTGKQTRHSINLSGGSEMLQMGGSFSYFNQEGVIPFSDFKSYNARVNGNLNFSKKFRMGASINFINSGGSRVNSDRYGEQLIYWSPRWDVMDYMKPDGTQKYYGLENDNPVYTLATNRFFDNVNRVIASTNFMYAPTDWLNFTYRFGNDFYNDARTRYAPGPKGVVDELVNSDNDFGFYQEHSIRNRVITSTFIANLNKDLGSNFNVNLNLGHDLRDVKLRRVSVTGDTLVVPDLFLLQNTKRILASNLINDKRIIGYFADLTFGFKNYLFLNVTGRNDITSTLAKDNRSYFYPSASLSAVFSDMVKLPTWWNYGKAKVSFATVAKDSYDPYATTTGFVAGTPIGGVLPWTYVDALGNPLLKPEFTNTKEAGLELRFFDNRLGLELTGYVAHSKDLIVPVKISNSTGFDEAFINAGEIKNRGIEISLNATPVRKSDFSWDFNINFSTNKNEVVKLNQGLNEILIESQFGYVSSNANMKLVPGFEYGALFGRSYKRYYGDKAEDPLRIDYSAPIVIGANGFPVIETRQKFLGNSLPDYIASTMQTLRWKGLSLSALLDVRQGQMKYNQFANFMAAFGTAKFTENRTETMVFDGVLADGTRNTKPVYLGQGIGPDGVNYGNGYYRNVYRGVTENFIEDASWVRLRSLSLSYSLPASILNRTKTIKGASISLTGNNLWLSTKFTGFDPESSSFSSGSNSSEGFSGFTYPGIKSYMATLNLQF